MNLAPASSPNTNSTEKPSRWSRGQGSASSRGGHLSGAVANERSRFSDPLVMRWVLLPVLSLMVWLGLPRTAFAAIRLELLPPVTRTDGAVGGVPLDLAFSETNDLVAVAQGPRGLALLQTNLVWLGTIGLDGVSSRVAFSGPLALVAAGRGGMHIVDVSMPERPRRLGGFRPAEAILDVAATRGVAFAADAGGAIHALDLSEPNAPSRLGTLTVLTELGVADEEIRLTLSGNLLFVAGDSSGLTLIDVSQPAAMKRLGNVLPSGGALGVAVDGTYAYVVGGARNLVVVEVTDPQRPRVASILGFAQSLRSIALSPGYVHLGTASSGTALLDLSNPASPRLLSEDLPAGPRAPIRAVHVVGDRLFEVEQGLGFETWVMVTPQLRVSHGVWTGSSILDDVAAQGTRACLAYTPPVSSRDSGLAESRLWLVDLQDSAHPRPAGHVAGAYGRMAVDGPRVYALPSTRLPQSGGLSVVEAMDLDAPRVLGMHATASTHVLARAGLVYLHVGAGLEILDFADPTFGIRVGLLDIPGTGAGLALSGALALVAGTTPTGSNQVLVVSVNDTSHPVRLGQLPIRPEREIRAVALEGELACVLESGGGAAGPLLGIFDLRNPANPVWTSAFTPPGSVQDVQLRGSLAYLATALDGLLVIDLRDPAAPRGIHRLFPGDNPAGAATTRLAVRGSEVLAAGPSGLSVVRSLPGLSLALRIHGAATGQPLTLEAAEHLGDPSPWTPVLTATPTEGPLDVIDPNLNDRQKSAWIYRVRQP